MSIIMFACGFSSNNFPFDNEIMYPVFELDTVGYGMIESVMQLAIFLPSQFLGLGQLFGVVGHNYSCRNQLFIDLYGNFG